MFGEDAMNPLSKKWKDLLQYLMILFQNVPGPTAVEHISLIAENCGVLGQIVNQFPSPAVEMAKEYYAFAAGNGIKPVWLQHAGL